MNHLAQNSLLSGVTYGLLSSKERYRFCVSLTMGVDSGKDLDYTKVMAEKYTLLNRAITSDECKDI